MVLELFLLGLFFVIILPLVFVCWNLFLFIMGRHPMLNPGVIKPEIDKLPKSVVERFDHLFLGVRIVSLMM